MKTRKSAFSLKFIAAALALLGLAATSCTTTYDAYGRPVQTVDPALAVAGIAAAGIVGYAIADNNRNDHYRGGKRYYDRGYQRPCRY
ncbi:MAG: hypothetical protein AAF591_01600 [Verrucomicrobiota bacterium]